ncbi:hypothetical protein V6Z12_D09G275100 [Gossypium hirsutum]|uniref:Uncharacterized protein n=1 Tax=Gossypium darwinii TaxID=34276 RepID=A0A5D2BEP3_GOSDA|nr:hypothetical protein ES288_D09G287800v1 [Gossypium darwinii]
MFGFWTCYGLSLECPVLLSSAYINFPMCSVCQWRLDTSQRIAFCIISLYLFSLTITLTLSCHTKASHIRILEDSKTVEPPTHLASFIALLLFPFIIGTL